MLNTKKQSREYTFIKPNRNPGQSKTFVVGSSSNSEAGDEMKETNNETRFYEIDGFKNHLRELPSQTQPCQKPSKLKKLTSDPCIKTQKSLKKPLSTKTNLLS